MCVGAGVSRRALFEKVEEEEEEEEEDGLDDWEQIDEDEIKLADGKIVVALLHIIAETDVRVKMAEARGIDADVVAEIAGSSAKDNRPPRT